MIAQNWLRTEPIQEAEQIYSEYLSSSGQEVSTIPRVNADIISAYDTLFDMPAIQQRNEKMKA